jgi:hypothetical protein
MAFSAPAKAVKTRRSGFGRGWWAASNNAELAHKPHTMYFGLPPSAALLMGQRTEKDSGKVAF